MIALAALMFSIPASGQAVPLDLSAVEARIERGELRRIVSIAVEQHGKTVYSKRFDGEAPGTPVDIRSAGKSITALAVGAAIADGKLAGTNVKVWPLLGSNRGEPFASIAVRDLITMSSALDCNDSIRRSPGQEERMYRTRVWRDFALGLPAHEEYSRDATGFGPFSYCTAGVFLLGQVVEEATGERFDAYVQRRLFDPLEIDSAIWRKSPSGEIQSGGQLRMSDTDLARLGRMVLDKGTWQGQRLLPESWIEEMLHDWRAPGEYVRYGYLWWANLVKSPRGYEPSWMMMGNGGNIVALFRDYDAVIVIQSENYNRDDAERNSFEVMWAVLEALPGPE